MKPLKDRFEAKVQKSAGCWLWTGALGSGYGEGRYGQIKHQGKTLRAHCVSYELHKAKIPEGMCVCHKCDNPRCVNPGHLFLGTHLDNMRDMFKKGRRVHAVGLRNGAGKLSNAQRAKALDRSRSAASLAAELNVSVTRVNQLRRAAASVSQGAHHG